ncbi:SDR family NAD(P)-dependent oxidoreductase [Acinetobacter higginsii]|uniref:SDR family NAD(P)-dependent oxidoreductase n=1 Tax=Acinetobacter higginsii TaxID=70347 RepID=UPI001F4AE78C|nr:SDR family NAD(P)-dependent oxidoreductase [Acinetobacter higginsii]MCH7303854.1 SDR family NAD(P)-dependent oxidoreductase [Acinetobacter higginsii]MDO3664209.1 SDR family NAD(P)-dependent oxidoreductase [Acinetobacter higginsii]
MAHNNLKTQQDQQVALVAGATGFIGRYLILELLKQGHRVFALVRNQAKQQPVLTNWLSQKGVSLNQLSFIQGDVTQAKLAISEQDWQKLSTVDTLYNSSALFAWNLSMQQAQSVNVEGALNLLTCVHQQCDLKRAVHVSGYMLTITRHLEQAGVCHEQPERTQWPSVYQHLGAYEASKIEAHFAWIRRAQQLSLDWTIIHPATVVGDDVSGEIPTNQPIAQMIDLLKRRKMSAIPATAQHYLPLIRVDDLCQVMVKATMDQTLANQAMLVVSEHSVALHQLTRMIADQLQVNAPTRHVPIGLLRFILKWPWLAKKLEMSTEMLSFLRTEQLDRERLTQFQQRWQISTGNLEAAIRKTTDWINQIS